MEDGRDSRPSNVQLSVESARERVRELAKDSANLVWTNHICERMAERGIDSGAVLRILRQGDIDSLPEAQSKPGEWKVKLTRMMPTGRVAAVVTVIVRDRRLILVTTEWEDRR